MLFLSRSFIVSCTIALFLSLVAPIRADIVHTLGDLDFFGFGSGIYGADNIPAFDVDNRTLTDPLFTDHDIRDSVLGLDDGNDVSWFHDLSGLLPASGINEVRVEIAFAGIQDNDFTPEFDDRIFLEGIEIPNALDMVDQGPVGTGVFQFILSDAQTSLFLSDGILNVEIDGGRRNSDGALESYFIDYSRTIVSVPEPASSAVIGISLVLCFRRRSRCA